MRDQWAVFAPMAALLLCPWSVGAAVTIEVGTAIGAPGRPAFIGVTLRADVEVAGTQNDLAFDLLTPVASRAGAVLRPDCTLNPRLGLLVTTPFAFRPVGCTPGEDCGVRALVLALNSGDPIPDGTVLYTCRVDVDPSAALGSYPVRCAHPSAANPEGMLLATACTDGAVQVVADLPTPTATPSRPPTRTPTPTETGTPCDPSCAAMRVGRATGRAGERVALPMRIDTDGQSINGVQADLGFDPAAAVAADAQGRPDCALNTSIGALSFATFSFQPPRCASASSCTGIRAIVSFDNGVAIPDGSELFTCTIAIASDATAASYQIPISHVAGSTSDGQPIPMTGFAGAVVVADSSGGGGCQVAAPHDRAGSLLAVAVLLACLAARRKSVQRIRQTLD